MTRRAQPEERAFSLVGMLAALAVVIVLFVFLYGRNANTPAPTRSGGPSTTLGQSLEKGKEVDCANNLSQIRLAIGMQMMNDPERPTAPASLQDLRREGISETMLRCPVSGQPYSYDPSHARVWCTTPGHEKF